MRTGKSIALLVTLTLVTAGTLSIVRYGEPRGPALDEDANHSRLFSFNNAGLEDRISKLEASLQESIQIQSQLFEQVEQLRNLLDEGTTKANSSEPRVMAHRQGKIEQTPRQQLPEDGYQKYREMQRRRFIDAGLNPETAEFILSKQERFQYDQMKLAYEFAHIEDKSSPQAAALQDKLALYNNPSKFFEQELSERDFELYMEASGSRQELRITNVLENTPAYDAGLRPGDKIVSYNGERVFHMGDLRSQVYRVDPGKTVAIEIQREGSSGTETIYVPSGPLGIRG